MPISLLHSDDHLTPFPRVETALLDPNGLLMAGGNLAPERLLQAYSRGIFPWYSEGEPILWWSPNPRCVLWPAALKISRSLKKTLHKSAFDLREDTAFRDVIEHCKAPRSGSNGTWILPEMIDAYCRLHRLGYAHSVECWQGGDLVGGLYGVRIGQVFFGESMFSRVSDASKVALAYLARETGLSLIDCQLPSAHLFSLGATTMPRAEFVKLLKLWAPLSQTKGAGSCAASP